MCRWSNTRLSGSNRARALLANLTTPGLRALPTAPWGLAIIEEHAAKSFANVLRSLWHGNGLRAAALCSDAAMKVEHDGRLTLSGMVWWKVSACSVSVATHLLRATGDEAAPTVLTKGLSLQAVAALYDGLTQAGGSVVLVLSAHGWTVVDPSRDAIDRASSGFELPRADGLDPWVLSESMTENRYPILTRVWLDAIHLLWEDHWPRTYARTVTLVRDDRGIGLARDALEIGPEMYRALSERSYPLGLGVVRATTHHLHSQLRLYSATLNDCCAAAGTVCVTHAGNLEMRWLTRDARVAVVIECGLVHA
ncbi:Hypothetical protein UVM_LOCUS196 [uncultured virus]|nr:Hypothetical protein UVM_LOCUS196 [uncultured virus]